MTFKQKLVDWQIPVQCGSQLHFGFNCGNRITSRMLSWPRSIMPRRSMPMSVNTDCPRTVRVCYATCQPDRFVIYLADFTGNCPDIHVTAVPLEQASSLQNIT